MVVLTISLDYRLPGIHGSMDPYYCYQLVTNYLLPRLTLGLTYDTMHDQDGGSLSSGWFRIAIDVSRLNVSPGTRATHSHLSTCTACFCVCSI